MAENHSKQKEEKNQQGLESGAARGLVRLKQSERKEASGGK